jgi:methionine-rich copper-binding protein CopC
MLVALLVPASVSAHADLQSSDPAQGATVPSPFSGPVVLTFTESLAVGSKADLYGPGHQPVASATIDAGTMTIATSGALTPGDYTVEWVSIADDGDLLRGTVAFTVAPPASPPPSSAPPASASAEPTSAATNPPTAAATTAVSPAPSSATSGANGSGGDVILPIVIALIVAAAGAFYLVRRSRPA